jgi:hypothetical protein
MPKAKVYKVFFGTIAPIFANVRKLPLKVCQILVIVGVAESASSSAFRKDCFFRRLGRRPSLSLRSPRTGAPRFFFHFVLAFDNALGLRPHLLWGVEIRVYTTREVSQMARRPTIRGS